MSGSDSTFVLVATYPDEATARDDYQVVKEAHAAGLVGSYDAAVITKDASGKIAHPLCLIEHTTAFNFHKGTWADASS